MDIKLCGQTLTIPDDATKKQQDGLIKRFVNKVISDIPEEVLDDIFDKAWIEVYGELTDARKQEIKAKAEQERLGLEKRRKKHKAAGSGFVVLSEVDMEIMRQVAIEDEKYIEERRLRREKKELEAKGKK